MAQTKIKYRQVEGGLDGWIPAEETWTYASATTITVPSGAASKYQKGDKIKITNNSATKYFYVVGVADTVLTVTGGTDYTVHDSAITNPYFSKIENPQGFPHWFMYTPSFTGFSSNPQVVAKFCLRGTVCFVTMRMGTPGTSNATGFTVTVPIKNSNRSTLDDVFGTVADVVNAGTVERYTVQAYLAHDSSNVVLQRAGTAAGWTNSGDKRMVGFNIFYEIA